MHLDSLQSLIVRLFILIPFLFIYAVQSEQEGSRGYVAILYENAFNAQSSFAVTTIYF